MRGTNTVRYCTRCEKNVYNISMLTECEAKAALAARPAHVCVHYHVDAADRVVFFPEPARSVALTVSLLLASPHPSHAQEPPPPPAPAEHVPDSTPCTIEEKRWQEAFDKRRSTVHLRLFETGLDGGLPPPRKRKARR
jgi:hypothetical protein